jgi:hypothetical protein
MRNAKERNVYNVAQRPSVRKVTHEQLDSTFSDRLVRFNSCASGGLCPRRAIRPDELKANRSSLASKSPGNPGYHPTRCATQRGQNDN